MGGSQPPQEVWGLPWVDRAEIVISSVPDPARTEASAEYGVKHLGWARWRGKRSALWADALALGPSLQVSCSNSAGIGSNCA